MFDRPDHHEPNPTDSPTVGAPSAQPTGATETESAVTTSINPTSAQPESAEPLEVEVNKLLLKYLDHQLSPAEENQLGDLLRQEEAARAQFVKTGFHAALLKEMLRPQKHLQPILKTWEVALVPALTWEERTPTAKRGRTKAKSQPVPSTTPATAPCANAATNSQPNSQPVSQAAPNATPLDPGLAFALRTAHRRDTLTSRVQRLQQAEWRLPRSREFSMVLVATLFLVVLFGRIHFWQADRLNPLAGKAPVAILSESVQAKWHAGELMPEVGTELPPGRLILESGLAQLEFYSGATVVLQGPVDFELVSTNEGYCRYGKLRGRVPPQAKGFRINSPSLAVVDLGTEFGMKVQATGAAEVHVFEGKVQVSELLTTRRPAPQLLKTGEGFRLESSGVSRRVPVEEQSFVGPTELVAKVQQQQDRSYQDWQQSIQSLRQHPHLIVAYPFDQQQSWERILRGFSNQPNLPIEGSLVGCTWTQGRWQNKGALQFQRVGDRVRLSVPGEWDALTLVAWVRLSPSSAAGQDRPAQAPTAWERPAQTLFCSDGHQPGAIRWWLGTQGELSLTVDHDAGPEQFDSLPGLVDLAYEQWVCLATTLNPNTRLVQHYLNGRQVRRLGWFYPLPLQIGNANLGNDPPGLTPSVGQQHPFQGKWDELLIFNSALEAADIQQLYLAGKPQ